MIQTIIREPDPILRKRQPYITDKSIVDEIVQDLWDTLEDSDSVGFAANQIGAPYRICVVSPDIVLVNPEIIKRSGKEYKIEGCMSIPGYYASIPRNLRITIQTLYGQKILTHDQARFAQHEIDHLDGILIRDYVENTHGRKGGILAWEKSKSSSSYLYFEKLKAKEERQ